MNLLLPDLKYQALRLFLINCTNFKIQTPISSSRLRLTSGQYKSDGQQSDGQQSNGGTPPATPQLNSLEGSPEQPDFEPNSPYSEGDPRNPDPLSNNLKCIMAGIDLLLEPWKQATDCVNSIMDMIHAKSIPPSSSPYDKREDYWSINHHWLVSLLDLLGALYHRERELLPTDSLKELFAPIQEIIKNYHSDKKIDVTKFLLQLYKVMTELKTVSETSKCPYLNIVISAVHDVGSHSMQHGTVTAIIHTISVYLQKKTRDVNSHVYDLRNVLTQTLDVEELEEPYLLGNSAEGANVASIAVRGEAHLTQNMQFNRAQLPVNGVTLDRTHMRVTQQLQRFIATTEERHDTLKCPEVEFDTLKGTEIHSSTMLDMSEAEYTSAEIHRLEQECPSIFPDIQTPSNTHDQVSAKHAAKQPIVQFITSEWLQSGGAELASMCPVTTGVPL